MTPGMPPMSPAAPSAPPSAPPSEKPNEQAPINEWKICEYPDHTFSVKTPDNPEGQKVGSPAEGLQALEQVIGSAGEKDEAEGFKEGAAAAPQMSSDRMGAY